MVYICMFACICVCVWVCMLFCVCVCVCVYACMCVCVCVRALACVNILLYVIYYYDTDHCIIEYVCVVLVLQVKCSRCYTCMACVKILLAVLYNHLAHSINFMWWWWLGYDRVTHHITVLQWSAEVENIIWLLAISDECNVVFAYSWCYSINDQLISNW